MKRIYLILTLILASFNSFAQKTPIELNDKMAAITDSLYMYGQEWGAAVNKAAESADWTQLVLVRKKLESYVVRATKIVNNTKDIKNSKPLRMAMLEFLAFEQKMIIGFLPFESFTSATSNETFTATVEKLTALSASENSQLENVRKAQEKYAGENGYSIEAASTDEK